jgi:hypothetical protein
VISQYYRINVNRTRQSRKFKAAQNVFNVSVTELPENSPTFVRRLFRDVLKNADQPEQLPPCEYRPPQFTQSKHLDEDKILNKIEGVQQSKKEIVISDGGMEIDFFHVKYPEGSGGAKMKHLHLDKEKFKRSKRAIIQIHNPWDSLCLPRAIVVTRLHAQKPEVPNPDFDKKWTRMRKGDHDSLDQKQQALALMEQAGCDTS